MSVVALGHRRAGGHSGEQPDFFPYSAGGFVLGVVTTILAITIDLTVLVTAQWSSGTGYGTGWPQAAVVSFGIFSVVVAVVMGRWLFRLRRWIGSTDDPADRATVLGKRRHFAVGAMMIYAPLAPVVCVLMVAFANST